MSNIGRPNGPAYSTGELLNTPQNCSLPWLVRYYRLVGKYPSLSFVGD